LRLKNLPNFKRKVVLNEWILSDFSGIFWKILPHKIRQTDADFLPIQVAKPLFFLPSKQFLPGNDNLKTWTKTDRNQTWIFSFLISFCHA